MSSSKEAKTTLKQTELEREERETKNEALSLCFLCHQYYSYNLPRETTTTLSSKNGDIGAAQILGDHHRGWTISPGGYRRGRRGTREFILSRVREQYYRGGDKKKSSRDSFGRGRRRRERREGDFSWRRYDEGKRNSFRWTSCSRIRS